MDGRISTHDKGISIEYNGHVIRVGWSRYVDIFVDNHYCSTVHVSSSVYKRLIKPLINGVAGDDVIDCLALIASTYRSARARSKYVTALAYIGPGVKKWIGKRPSAYLKRRADLIYIRKKEKPDDPPSKYLLAFLCNNGWIVVDMTVRGVYACVRDDDGSHFFVFGCYKDLFAIALAELLPSLKEDLRNIQRLRDYGFLEEWAGGPWVISHLLEKIPMEWWRPLDIEAMIIEQELKRIT
jgi:hypothetical protein